MRQDFSDGGPGQQCCYDKNGNLITGGESAGTPDKVAPQGPFDTYFHWEEDVQTFNWCKDSGNIDKYWEVRPPNNGNKCKENKLPKKRE